MPKIRKMPDGRWRTSRQVGGKRVFIKGRSLEDVEKRLGELLQRKPVKRKNAGPTFAEVTALFLQAKEANSAPDSFRFYQFHATRKDGMAGYFGDRLFSELKLEDFKRFIEVRLTTKAARGDKFLSRQTVDHERSILLQIALFAEDRGLVDRTPITSRSLPKLKLPELEPRALSDHELQLVMRACPADVRPLIEIFLHTGIRLSEAKRMTWKWVRLDQGVLVVLASKSGKLRTVPLTATAKAAFKALPIKTGFVVEGNWGDILDGRIYAILRAISREAGLPRFGLHILRHTFCTTLLRASKNVYAVEKAAGHSDPKITRRYTNAVAGEEIRGELDQMGERFAEILDQAPLRTKGRKKAPSVPTKRAQTPVTRIQGLMRTSS